MVTNNESTHMSQTKQHSTMWVFHDEQSATEVIGERSTSN